MNDSVDNVGTYIRIFTTTAPRHLDEASLLSNSLSGQSTVQTRFPGYRLLNCPGILQKVILFQKCQQGDAEFGQLILKPGHLAMKCSVHVVRLWEDGGLSAHFQLFMRTSTQLHKHFSTQGGLPTAQNKHFTLLHTHTHTNLYV